MWKEVNCFNWRDNATNTLVTCQCPNIVDVDITLPYNFKFTFAVNPEKKQQKLSTTKEILYYKPRKKFEILFINLIYF